MGRNMTFGLLVTGLLMLAAPGNLIAQCSWCTTVTDECCDGNFSSVDYTLPCTTNKIYVYYDAPGNDRVHVLIYDVSGGGEIFVAERDMDGQDCNCAKYQVYAGTDINSGHVLRFKIECQKCNDEDTSCETGTASVKFYTPSTNTCAPNCNGS